MPNEKPNAKTPVPKLPRSWWEWVQALLQSLFGLTHNWQKTRDIVSNNYELGLRHFKLGHISDAILRFKLVTWLDPKHAKAWYHLGAAYIADGQAKLAKAALVKALALKPDDEEASYMLAIAGGKSTPVSELPRRIPPALVQEHFDAQAVNFSETQLQEAGYQGHTLLANLLRVSLVPGRIDHAILELGVGTGLCGSQLRDLAASLTGVDMSQPMLEEAMKLKDVNGKQVYDALIRREAHDFLREAPQAYDIVLAAGLLSYIGDLQPIFQQVGRVLKTGGIFAFTADKTEGDDFRFDPLAGRFRYSKSYLEMLGRQFEMEALKFEEAEIYPGYMAWLCVFAK